MKKGERMDLVSIIVPIYNVEPYIDKCIQSILNQTYKAFELLLIDDGSTDRCPEICDKYAKMDSRIKTFHKTNGGLVSARKFGLSNAVGEYITYVDGDDWIDCDLLELTITKIKENNADILIYGYKEGTEQEQNNVENKIESGVYKGKNLCKLYEKMLYTGLFYEAGIIPAAWNKIYKKSVLYSRQMDVPNELRMGEDAAFTYLTMLDSSCICIANEIKSYNYRMVPRSMSRTFDKEYFVRLDLYYQMLDNKIKELHLISWKNLQYYWSFLILLGFSQLMSCRSVYGIADTLKMAKKIFDECNMIKSIAYDEVINLPFIKKMQIYCVKKKKFGIFLCIHIYEMIRKVIYQKFKEVV